MSMYTTAQLLAANEQKFKFDPLFLRLFFRESYPFTTEKVYLSFSCPVSTFSRLRGVS